MHKMCIAKVSHNDKTSKIIVGFGMIVTLLWALLLLEIKINCESWKCDSQQAGTERNVQRNSVRPVRKVSQTWLTWPKRSVRREQGEKKWKSTRRKPEYECANGKKIKLLLIIHDIQRLYVRHFCQQLSVSLESKNGGAFNRGAFSSFISQHSQRLYICQAFSVSSFIYEKLTARNAHKQIHTLPLPLPINFRQFRHSFTFIRYFKKLVNFRKETSRDSLVIIT